MQDRIETDEEFLDESDHKFNEVRDDVATGHASDDQAQAWADRQRRLAEKYHREQNTKRGK